MDANVHIDKSEVLQVMQVAGWKDVSSGLGDTFRCGFSKKLVDDTIEWRKQGEAWSGEALAPSNIEIEYEQTKDIGAE